MKDHQISQIVSELTKIAVEFSQTQQLRERIAYCIVPHIKELQTLLNKE